MNPQLKIDFPPELLAAFAELRAAVGRLPGIEGLVRAAWADGFLMGALAGAVGVLIGLACFRRP